MRVIKALMGPLALLALAAAICVVGVVVIIRTIDQTSHEFTGPGRTTIELREPGRQFIWHEVRTTRAGTLVTVAESLPTGTTFTVRGPDGASVLVEPAVGMTVETPQRRRVSVARFEVVASGPHEIAVSGLTEERHFAVGDAQVGAMVTATFGFTCATVIIGGAGLIWLIVALVRILAKEPTATAADGRMRSP